MIIPIFEMVPFVNLIPFWTGTVLLLWLKVKREKRKIVSQEKAEIKKLQSSYA